MNVSRQPAFLRFWTKNILIAAMRGKTLCCVFFISFPSRLDGGNVNSVWLCFSEECMCMRGKKRRRQMDCWCWGEGLRLRLFPLLAREAEERCGCFYDDTTAALQPPLYTSRWKVDAVLSTTVRHQNLDQLRLVTLSPGLFQVTYLCVLFCAFTQRSTQK